MTGKLVDALSTGLLTALQGLHTGNGEEIAHAVNALIDGRLLHLQGAVDRLIDQVTALRSEITELQQLRGKHETQAS